jgi:DNA modification methylase
MFSVKGDIVVDPFCGVGTTLKVAEELDRKPVGYEINEGINRL